MGFPVKIIDKLFFLDIFFGLVNSIILYGNFIEFFEKTAAGHRESEDPIYQNSYLSQSKNLYYIN